MTSIVHATRTCPDCETRTAVQLYHFSFNDGRNVSIAHACEHVIRDCQPDDPPRAEWLAAHAVPPSATCSSSPALN